MSRVKDAILVQKGWARGANAPLTDLQFGGQMGYAQNYTEWVSNAAYVRKNLIPLLVEYPRGFNFLPEKNYWISTLRALVELHALSIDGLAAGLEVAVIENPAGGAGQMQEDFSDVTQARSNVQIRWPEKYGAPISRFWSSYIRMLMMDPETKVAGISTIAGARPGDMLPDMWSFTMMFIEPDPQHSKVLRSWLVTNMFPHGTGEIIGRREIGAAGEGQQIDLGFGGLAQFGYGVDLFAQRLLDGIDITGANPLNRPAFVQQIDADVLAVNRGYRQGAEELGASAVSA